MFSRDFGHMDLENALYLTTCSVVTFCAGFVSDYTIDLRNAPGRVQGVMQTLNRTYFPLAATLTVMGLSLETPSHMAVAAIPASYALGAHLRRHVLPES